MRRGSSLQALPSRFAWLVGGVLLHGHLLLQDMADDTSVTEGAEYVADMRQLALAGAHGSPEDEPHMMVGPTTGYVHMLYKVCTKSDMSTYNSLILTATSAFQSTHATPRIHFSGMCL